MFRTAPTVASSRIAFIRCAITSILSANSSGQLSARMFNMPIPRLCW